MEQIKSGVTEQRPERCANTPVYFGLTLNYEAGSIFGPGKTKAVLTYTLTMCVWTLTWTMLRSVRKRFTTTTLPKYDE